MELIENEEKHTIQKNNLRSRKPSFTTSNSSKISRLSQNFFRLVVHRTLPKVLGLVVNGLV